MESLIESLSQKLKRHGLKLCTAESCTGGMVSAACTSVAGSSDWFNGAIVSYSNEMKMKILGVPQEIIARHGAVSLPCAEAMVRGALLACGADCAISLTGIAGPGGGSEGKPVGTVIIGAALPARFADATQLPPDAGQSQPDAGQFQLDAGQLRADNAISPERETLVFAIPHLFPGNRDEVRRAAMLAALTMMERILKD